MDKKNTLLLTVIAIATLLVAVVGATFAYFSAQAGEGKNAQINVKTSTTDTLTFSAKPIYLIATQQNFASVNGVQPDDKIGSQKAVSTSTVEYQKGGEGSTDYCYTATVKIDSNNFQYAPEQTDFKEDQDGRNRTTSFTDQKVPELLLKITKSSQTNSDGPKVVSYTENVGSVLYKSLSTNRRICTQNNETDVTGDSVSYTGNCVDNQPVAGLDITGLSASTEIKLPTEASGKDLNHKLTATAEKDKVVDTWTAELVFVNYDWDQQYNASTPELERKLSATFEFKRVDCD